MKLFKSQLHYTKKNSKRSRGPHNDDHEIQLGQATVLHTFLISQEINSNHSGLRQAWRSHQITSTLNLLPVGPKFTRPACRAAVAISAARARPQQQTRWPPLLLSIDGTDRRTDTQRYDTIRDTILTCARKPT